MLLLHDPTVGHSIRSRIQALSPTAHHRWGKMSVDQMLWHCNQVLSTSLGDMQVVQRLPPFPVPILKLMLFHLPWPHGAPTAPEYKAEGPRAFEAERTQCLELIDRFTARKLEEGTWARSAFGALSDFVLNGDSDLPRATAERHLARSNMAATTHRFFHWELEFPEVFLDASGQRLRMSARWRFEPYAK